MKKSKIKVLGLIVFLFLLTGCTQYIQGVDGTGITNETTGKRLAANLLCRPVEQATIDAYNKADIELEAAKLEDPTIEGEVQNVEALPACEDFKINTGGYEGLWVSILVKPLAWALLKLGTILNNYGIALVLAGLLIRLAMYPMTRKTAMQSEKMKEIKPKMDKIEAKYKGRDDKEAQAQKAQEMQGIYKKEGVSPLGGCLTAVIQLPLFIAFFEAINRVPAIFEGNLLGFNLGTTPLFAIQNGEWHYIIICLIIIASSYFSFAFNQQDNPGMSGKQGKIMMYIFVGFIGFASFTFPVAIGFYWITSTTFTIVQNLIVKRGKKK